MENINHIDQKVASEMKLAFLVGRLHYNPIEGEDHLVRVKYRDDPKGPEKAHSCIQYRVANRTYDTIVGGLK